MAELNLANADDRALLVGLVRSAVNKTSKERPAEDGQMATVIESALGDENMAIWIVHFDGDPQGELREVVDLINGEHEHGDRVYVHFKAPHGAYIMGPITIPPPT